MSYPKNAPSGISLSLLLTGFLILGGCVQQNGLVDDTGLTRKSGLAGQTGTPTQTTPQQVGRTPDTAANAGADTESGVGYIAIPERVELSGPAPIAQVATAPIPPVIHLPGPPAASRAARTRVYLKVAKQNLWHIFKQREQLKFEHHPRITSQLNWFVKNPEYLKRVVLRSTPYLYHIISELERNNLPVELALLPIIESAYRPFAFSQGRATGIWQFIPSTGRAFGLQQNWWYDGRRDIVASTAAAIKFFQQLESSFEGDWLKALAAYNAGPAKVRRAVKRNQKKNLPSSFWDLRLPRETRDYVPKFLALIEVVRHPQTYNIVLPPVDAKPYFVAIDTKTQIDLAWAAKTANTTIKQLYWLNPGFNRWATAPDGPHRLLVPVGSAENFKVALGNLHESAPVIWIRHKIVAGETLGSIAVRYKTTVRQLKKVNNIKGSIIVTGRNLMISGPRASASTYAYSVGQRLQTAQSQGSGVKRVHLVRSGDTLWDLAKSYNSSVRKIARWNNIATKTPLRVGQKLVIWQPLASKPTGGATKVAFIANFQPDIQIIRYVVRPGDSLNRIARRFNIQIADLFRWNSGLQNTKYIQPGQKIRLELDVRQQSG